MKNIVMIITLIGLLVFFSSCKKQRLPDGEYQTTLIIQADNTTFNPDPIPNEILESNNNYLVINNIFYGRDPDTLYRDGNNITGVLDWSCSSHSLGMGNGAGFADFVISGTVSKEKGVFYLKGTFTTLYYKHNLHALPDTFDATGTFEMKSIF